MSLGFWAIERAVCAGQATLAELDERARLEVACTLASRRRDAASRASFMRDRQTIPVPKVVSELELLQALATACHENDEGVRRYTWFRKRVERGEDPESDCDLLGHAGCDAIAASLVGVPITESWKVRHTRRVVAPLRRLVAAGLVCRGERNGVPYGYELTLDGIDFLVDAGAIDRLAEVAA